MAETLREKMLRMRTENPDATPETLAAKLLPIITKQDTKQLIIDEFWRLQRNETHTIEKGLSGLSYTTAPRRLTTTAFLDEIRPLLDKGYRWMTGEERKLRYMTIEEHEARIAMLRSKQAGISQSITIHERAIEMLRLTGASCLNELDKDDDLDDDQGIAA